MNDEVYLDNAATTRPWPEVVEAVVRVMTRDFGNASSRHRRGLAAAREVVIAQEAITALVGHGPWKVVFTSGGSEADTMAVLGTVPRGKRDTVISTTLEHAAVEQSCRAVAENGGHFVEIAAGTRGVIDPADIAASIDERSGLVTLTQVAGELGTVQPVAQVACGVKQIQSLCRVHVDAVQSLAQLNELGLPPEVDMVSISAHKIHGPQGIGALLLRPGVMPRKLIHGGDQQDGLRPGTLNLPGIVGFGIAADLYGKRREKGIAKMQRLTQRLTNELTTRVAGIRPLGDPDSRAPGIVVLAVEGVESEVLLRTLEARGVLASASSACHSTRKEPPRAMLDAGLKRQGEGALRFSLTLDTSEAQIERAAEAVRQSVEMLRVGDRGAR
jgi:cysteine desulfurase